MCVMSWCGVQRVALKYSPTQKEQVLAFESTSEYHPRYLVPHIYWHKVFVPHQSHSNNGINQPDIGCNVSDINPHCWGEMKRSYSYDLTNS
jgi:hypothetical protein